MSGTGLRVQTVTVAHRDRGLSIKEIAAEYGLNPSQVKEALDFYEAHPSEIDLGVAAEQALEAERG